MSPLALAITLLYGGVVGVVSGLGVWNVVLPMAATAVLAAMGGSRLQFAFHPSF